MRKEQITEQAAKELIKGKLSRYFGVAPAEARKEQLYKAVEDLLVLFPIPMTKKRS